MWIRRLEVAHWAGIAAAGIDFEPALNVLHGPNELGKSSLVAAIRAALLLQSSATAAEALRDWNSVEPPTVSLTFEQEPGRIWRVRKTFGGGGHAYLDFSRDGIEFSAEGKGREVDGALQNILRWGIEAPGGRGGRRGMPSSLITTALLGDQSDVAAILEQNLDDDPNTSGRERLTEALQALAEDPRFKQVVATVQTKVDEAFTTTGRKRTGRGSPWASLREQRENTAAREREIRQQVDESAGVRTNVENLGEQLLAAGAEAERLTAALSHHRQRKAAEQELEAAQAVLARAESAFRQLADNERSVAAANQRIQQLEAEHDAHQQALAALTAQLEAARERVRELESGANEQHRQLREQAAENRHLKLVQEKTAHDRRVAEAGNIAALEKRIQTDAAGIESLETALADKRELLKRARESTASDQDQLEELDLERCVWRYLAAQAATQAAEEQRDTTRRLIERAAELDRQAATLRAEAESLNAPDDAEIGRLQTAETEWRLARAKLSVGFLAEVTLVKSADAAAEVDGEPQTLALPSGERVELEADEELKLDIADVATIRIRGGRRGLLAAAQAAEERWLAASGPVFGRAGCSTIGELAARSKQAAGLLEDAADLSRQADDARRHGEALDQHEQRLVTERASLGQAREAVAEFLNAGETVEQLVTDLGELRNDEHAIGRKIDALQQQIRERERLCDGMDNVIATDGRELERGQADLAASRVAFAAAAEKMADWPELRARADEEGKRLNDALAAVASEMQAIRSTATAEVDTGHQELEALLGRHASALQAARQRSGRLDGARTELARLEGETGPLRANVEGQDLEAARAARDSARDAVSAIPPIDDDVDVTAMEGDAARAARLVHDLESDLRKAEGALEQIGGQYLDEQRQQVEEALQALESREHELELDYGGWQLLRETLSEAEQAGTAHLGNALVEPVSRRMGVLTDGRYGDIAIGPHLDATGIELAGGERQFRTLSVGTQEQIALLLRVAIGEALGSFVILDDQLTQSDPGRMTWMRDLLTEAAQRIQVVVLTCHPADYRVDGPQRFVDLTQCLARSDASPTSARPTPSQADRATAEPPRRRRRSVPHKDDDADDLTAALKESLKKHEG